MRFAAGGCPDVNCRAGIGGVLLPPQLVKKLTKHKKDTSQQSRFMSASRVRRHSYLVNLWAQVSYQRTRTTPNGHDSGPTLFGKKGTSAVAPISRNSRVQNFAI